MKAFSVVIPVKDEAHFIKKHVPSWISLRPTEIILCFDSPAPNDCLVALDSLHSLASINNVVLKAIEVPYNSEYFFQQANIRRTGFKEANNDVILTGDIDLIVTPECLKAVDKVGKNDVGLVSLSKYKFGEGFQDWVRLSFNNLVRFFTKSIKNVVSEDFVGKTYFTGLYAFYRQNWINSEGEGIKCLKNPKYAKFSQDSETEYNGEDVYLRNQMIKKFRCLYLSEVGAVDIRPSIENTPDIQLRLGEYFMYSGRGLLRTIVHSVIHVKPYVLVGWVSMKFRDRN